MRRVSTEQLRTGDRIGRDVFASPDAPPLLRAGIRVSDSYRQSLQRYNITSVWIDDGLSDGIEPLEVLSENTKRRATVAIRDAFRDVSQVAGGRKHAAVDTVQEMTEVAELIVQRRGRERPLRARAQRSRQRRRLHDEALARRDRARPLARPAGDATVRLDRRCTASGASTSIEQRLSVARRRAAAARHRQAGGAGGDSAETGAADR